MSLKDKTILITGGASGIGFACAKYFLLKGAKGVALLDINTTIGLEASNSLSKICGDDKVIFLPVDVVNKQSFEEAFERAIKKFGQVDILINSAGIMDEYKWEKTLDVNIKGTANGCYLAIEKYLKNNTGALIINLSSLAGLVPCDQAPFYTMSKYAIIGLTRALGSDFNFQKTGIKVIAICPGKTITPILDDIPLKIVHAKEFQEIIDTQVGQSTEQLAECILEIIDTAKNGSAWLIDCGKAHEVNLQDYQSLFKA